MTVAHYEQTVQLDGRSYAFRYDWNGRLARWKLSVLDAATLDPLLTGRTLVDGWVLNARSRDPRLPSGAFYVMDPSGSGIDPGFADLGVRTRFYFVPYASATTPGPTVVAEPV